MCRFISTKTNYAIPVERIIPDIYGQQRDCFKYNFKLVEFGKQTLHVLQKYEGKKLQLE